MKLTIIGASIDANTTCGVALADGAILHTTDVHWEDTGGTSPYFVCGPTAGSKIDITGGVGYDNNPAGNSTIPWFVAGIVQINGLQVLTPGGTANTSVAIAKANTRGMANVYLSPPFTGGAISGAQNIQIVTQQSGGNANSFISSPLFITNEQSSAPSNLSASAQENCYGDSATHLLLCNYNGGTNPHPLRLIETGTCTLAGSPATCTVTWARAFNATPLCFVSWNGTGTLTGILQAVPSPTNCVITDSVNGDTGVLQVEGVAAPN